MRPKSTLAAFQIESASQSKTGPVQRLRFRLFNRSALITIPRAFLVLPVPQILTQVRGRFGSDLQPYQVVIQM